ncbi:MAG: hypothetical protein HYW49_01390 [Deltaproteobacteria bacterium]|nr:hypothetical protein [Deltaproteobacteria bacterium]
MPSLPGLGSQVAFLAAKDYADRLLGIFVLGTLFAALAWTAAWAAPADTGVPVENEVQKLEHGLKGGKLRGEQRTRLAEIYFLTSRCKEAKDLLEEEPQLHPEILCACGSTACRPDTDVGRLARLRVLLEKPMPFESDAVQAFWTKLRDLPEAKYLALRSLRERLKRNEELPARLQARMREWEDGLESLEPGSR